MSSKGIFKLCSMLYRGFWLTMSLCGVSIVGRCFENNLAMTEFGLAKRFTTFRGS